VATENKRVTRQKKDADVFFLVGRGLTVQRSRGEREREADGCVVGEDLSAISEGEEDGEGRTEITYQGRTPEASLGKERSYIGSARGSGGHRHEAEPSLRAKEVRGSIVRQG